MADETGNEDTPFVSEYQNGVFTFTMLMVEKYRESGMDPQQAVNTACDWLISLATHLKNKSLEIAQENVDKSKLFNKAQ